MCSSITCLVILQDKLAAFVFFTDDRQLIKFRKPLASLPYQSETGQEIRKRTFYRLDEHLLVLPPIYLHGSSKLIDTLDISAIYSLGQALQKETETRNVIAIYF